MLEAILQILYDLQNGKMKKKKYFRTRILF